MRVAILSDLHANLHALEAVAKDVEREACDEVWCLGDIVGYGAHPREVLEWVHLHADVVVKGNHDHAVATGDASGFNPIASAAARYHAQLLTPPERARLHDYPESLHRAATPGKPAPRPRAGGPETRAAETRAADAARDARGAPTAASVAGGLDALLVHASPEDPLREYVLPSLARNRLATWAGDADLLLMGHTHVPFIARLPGKVGAPLADDGFAERVEASDAEAERALTVVNPGSVGQPRDGDPRAAWALLDVDARRVTLRRVAYDVDAAALAIRQARLDAFLASRLYRGV